MRAHRHHRGARAATSISVGGALYPWWQARSWLWRCPGRLPPLRGHEKRYYAVDLDALSTVDLAAVVRRPGAAVDTFDALSARIEYEEHGSCGADTQRFRQKAGVAPLASAVARIRSEGGTRDCDRAGRYRLVVERESKKGSAAARRPLELLYGSDAAGEGRGHRPVPGGVRPVARRPRCRWAIPATPGAAPASTMPGRSGRACGATGSCRPERWYKVPAGALRRGVRERAHGGPHLHHVLLRGDPALHTGPLPAHRQR
ncbi:hypothetical protein FHX80_112794 [Streptomyces brevispora]|uniref:Uncharacterized protein n=1 Tax=Streptomyces brevispora TaxID=887462 RepID=A0A561UYA4_9ACTN|nr:hypothetical protein FHX80_112794 [Streptomyces brevispora]